MDATVKRGEPAPIVLVVDDDVALAGVLARTLERSGMRAVQAHSAQAATRAAVVQAPDYAVVDLRLPDGTGLQLVARLLAKNPGMRVIILTGHSSIATAVEAIKLGAVDYLVKPVDADAILAALMRKGTNPDVPVADKPMSVSRLEWEHINRVLHEHGGNISATARALSLHRRTLQRKLAKHPVRS